MVVDLGSGIVDRLIVDIDSGGAASVSVWLEGEVPRDIGSVELRWPLAAEDGESLRWYVEDFLRAPFGVYEEQGPRIEGSLRGWGEQIFGALFGEDPVRDAFVAARTAAAASRRGLEVVFQSSEPGWLGLPWELMRQPGDPEPLVLGGVAVSRALPATRIGESFQPDVKDRSLRVLMVISRPEGEADVGFQMVARPLLQRLEAVRGYVELTVLRPPTLKALEDTLRDAAARGKPFQVVHFDGHGVMPGRDYGGPGGPGAGGVGDGRRVMFAGQKPGVLVFEKPEGGPDRVSAEVVGQILAAGRVPLVVLNACQSGAVGKELEAAVATRLMLGGAASVVAMAYSVYAVAAAEFMALFYERLFAGNTVTHAVAAGRAQLVKRPLRPSPKGELALADWFVPVHYTRRELSFPGLQTTRPAAAPSLEKFLDDIRDRPDHASGNVLAAVGEFVGRDGLFYTLEVVLPRQRVVILQGPGGTGKTELAKAFARWWRDTGGVDDPQLVIWHSFEPGVASFGLDGVITSIGLQVFGADFARLDDTERRTVVAQLLNQHRLLLIWDNFESVHTLPDPTIATPALDDDAKAELAGFVQKMAAGGGRSVLIITSRTGEDWLGEGLRRVEVAGLVGDEITAYTDQILAPYPTTRAKRQTPVFAQLLKWLDGHPLSMRLILPHLEQHSAQGLLDGLRGVMPLPGSDGGDRLTSLPASITYSFTHLPADVAETLVAVSVFHQVTDADVLAFMSTQDGCPARFTGPAGEAFQDARQRWDGILDAANAVGLLTNLGGGMYRIHPALPAYLTARWRHTTENHAGEREATEQAVLTGFANLMNWADSQIGGGDAGTAFTVIEHHQANLLHNLNRALQHRDYDRAQTIVQPLNRFWDARGLSLEADGWVDRVRDLLETSDGTPPGFDTAAGGLWLFMVGAQANRQQLAGLLDQAEHTYLDILTALSTQPQTPTTRYRTAVVQHQLGIVAQRRGRLEEAEEWYRKSLTIDEELRDRPGMATGYHQLARVAQLRGRLEEAEAWNRKSLTIKEELGDRPGMANSYHQLGMVAQGRGRLEEAEEWYRKSLTIREELGDRPGMATGYHQLGIVAELRGRLEEAEAWYRKSLTIKEELGDRPGMANGYHQLGMVAQERGRLDDADAWYRKSLTIEEELGNKPGMAMSYGQLGLLAEVRGNPREALEWTVRCIALFLPEFPSPSTGPAPQHLRRLTRIVGIDALEQVWRAVTDTRLPAHIRAFVEAED
jgi:tetratricopeptide (TPR) repeat protein/tRNA A37 threonylcarbamoyladenosine biosynthesis protein TsaE